MTDNIKIVFGKDGNIEKTEALALLLHKDILIEPPVNEPYLFFENGDVTYNCDGISMSGDFTKMLPRLKMQNLNGEMLIKAVRIKGCPDITVVDATAGLGEDSVLLAAYGYRVHMIEYDPVVACLLDSAMEKARGIDGLSDIVSRMTLEVGDSTELLGKLDFAPDVVYLDPMFPERRKSGLVKKKFQLIHTLEKPCDNEEKLLLSAMALHPKKIVVKRPLKGEYLAGIKPDYSIEGKVIRYDCITAKQEEL